MELAENDSGGTLEPHPMEGGVDVDPGGTVEFFDCSCFFFDLTEVNHGVMTW